MMTLSERIQVFEILFEGLQLTDSRIEKEQTVAMFEEVYPELKEDWTYILETLDGKHPIGWKFTPVYNIPVIPVNTVKELIKYCENTRDKTFVTTNAIETIVGIHGEFLAPIVNRTLRLGIGKSLLAKSDLTPMLAKKYEGGTLRGDIVVTEKLDGNRCIAHYDGNKWCFTSRSGKPMKVDFDMTGMNTELIYDGEVMSEKQTELSMQRHDIIINNKAYGELIDTQQAQLLFNETSGLINRHGSKSLLVYNIFDIISSRPYLQRRQMLVECKPKSMFVRILPILYAGNDINKVNSLLDIVTHTGGEGVMLNLVDRGYEHKRSDALLKYKQVQFMDMLVLNIYEGTGKYTGMVGGIRCGIDTADGKHIVCDVGSGLSDMQRDRWSLYPEEILGKIVQIGYHEVTQNRAEIGTSNYSLRFPRLIKVRHDKIETSEF
jgi:ATP-dependent DNA ligase